MGSGVDGPKRPRRLQASLRTMIALVACCGAISWGLRYVWENSDPVLVEARSVQRRALAALGAGRPADRLAAIGALRALRFGDITVAIPPLSGALDDPEAEVRVAAAGALASVVPGVVKSRSGAEAVRSAVAGLVRRLDDPDQGVRLAAIGALGAIGEALEQAGPGGEARPAPATALVRCLKDPEPGVRIATVAALGKIAAPEPAAGATPEPAAGATPSADQRAAVDALARVRGDRDAKVRAAAMTAMLRRSRGGDPPGELADFFEDESAENREAAIRSLLAFRKGLDPWASRLLRLAEDDPDPSVREASLHVLTYAFKPPALTAAAVPALRAGLVSEAARVRTVSATLLGGLGAGARAAIPDLIRVTNEALDPDVTPERGPIFPRLGPDVVLVSGPVGDSVATFDPGRAAAKALGQIARGTVEQKAVIAALMDVARSGPVSRRGWAVSGLGEFGPAAEEAVPVVIQVFREALPDNTFERVPAAARSLGTIGPGTPSADQAVAALRAVLPSDARIDRASVIRALGRFGTRAAAAIPEIRALKDDHDAEVREAATKALFAIEDQGPR